MTSNKIYVVRIGKEPGIYKTWGECKRQIDGYKGAVYKSFTSIEAARESVAEANTAADSCFIAGKTCYNIYVDGSFSKPAKKYSWAFVVFYADKLLYQASGIGDNAEAAAMHNVAGELAGAMRAIAWAVGQDIKPVVLYHDYIGIAAWATGDWQAKNKFTKAYAAFMAPHLDWVRFNKVKGHSGISGNELADMLAGEALKQG